MRASRLVALLLLLQARGGMTAAELARELEVSVRTIHRDVEALGAAGVPVYAERGPHGGIRLVDGYRTRLTGMTSDEAEALFLSGLPGPAAELGLGTVVASSRLKVLAALPPELRGRATRLLERFHLDAAGWFRAGEPVPHLAAIADCVWEGRRLEIDYDRGDRIVTRTLDPLGLVLKAGTWYLVATHDDQLRTYRISRVRGAAALDERARRPDGFDLAAYWTESIATFERETPRIDVTIRVRRDAARRLEDVLDASVAGGRRRAGGPGARDLAPAPDDAGLAAGGRGPPPRHGRRPRGARAGRAARGDRRARGAGRRDLRRAGPGGRLARSRPPAHGEAPDPPPSAARSDRARSRDGVGRRGRRSGFGSRSRISRSRSAWMAAATGWMGSIGDTSLLSVHSMPQPYDVVYVSYWQK